MSFKLSVIIPAYNEAKNILNVLDSLQKNLAGLQSVEFVVVDDGSSDNTVAVLSQSSLWGKENFQFISHPRNRGKGAAVLSALKIARGEYVIIQDADLEYFPEDIPKIYAYAIQNNAPVVFGSRNLGNNKRGGFLFYWGGRFLSLLTNILYQQKITDEATGYKLVKREIIQSLPLTCRGFEFCPQFTALVSRQGYKIAEVGIKYQPRSANEGKKIRYRDGFLAIYELIRLRLVMVGNFWSFCLVVGTVGFLYLFTWSGNFMGYEHETAGSALGFLNGVYDVRRAGPGATVMYLPFAIVGKIFLSDSEKIMKFLNLAPIFYSALTVGFMFLTARLISKRQSVALLFSALVAAGSLIWPYAKIGMEYQAMFLLSVILYLLLVWKSNPTRKMIWLLGGLSAFLAITKSYGIILAAPVGLFWILNDKKFITASNWGAKIKRILFADYFWILVLCSALAVAVSLTLSFIIFSKFSGPYSLAHEFQIWAWWEGFYGIFFAASKSIFIYSPLLILTLFYWRQFYARFKDVSVFILSTFVLLFIITAPFSYWTDETLSVRKLIPIIPFLHFPLLLFLENPLIIRWKKFLAVMLIFVAIYVQFINSLYPYWEQLVILRSGSQNSLTTLRYSPQLSHLAVNSRLFVAFLENKFLGVNNNFTYKENHWMNSGWTISEYININYDVSEMRNPRLFWLQSINARNRAIFFSLWSAGFIAFNLIFWFNYRYYRRIEMMVRARA